MSKRRTPLLYALLLLALAALPAALFSDMPARRPARGFLEVSVLVRGAEAGSWANLRQGIDQAANDLRVEIRFITLTDANDPGEQAALLAREVEGGADAVLLSAADSRALAEAVAAAAARLPVVTLESPVASDKVTAHLSADDAAMGRALAAEIDARERAGRSVLLLRSSPGSDSVSARLAALEEALTAAGFSPAVLDLPANADAAGELLAGELTARPPDIVAAVEPAVLELSARCAQKLPRPPALYGVGATSAIASYLERGLVGAIVVPNDFVAGYLALGAAVSAVEKRPVGPIPLIDFTAIRRSDMYEPDNQKLLFPFVR